MDTELCLQAGCCVWAVLPCEVGEGMGLLRRSGEATGPCDLDFNLS